MRSLGLLTSTGLIKIEQWCNSYLTKTDMGAAYISPYFRGTLFWYHVCIAHLGSPVGEGAMTPAKVVPSTSLLHQQLEMHAQKTLLGALIMLVVWDTLLYSWIKSNSHSIASSLSLMSCLGSQFPDKGLSCSGRDGLACLCSASYSVFLFFSFQSTISLTSYWPHVNTFIV